MNKVIRVRYTGSRWLVVAAGKRWGEFLDPIAAINFALDTVSAKLEWPVIWPESVVLA